MMRKLLRFLPLFIIITAMSGLIYMTTQQIYRQSANDPQIQIAEDVADQLAQGRDAGSLNSAGIVEISKSLSPFVMVYDKSGKLVATNARLDGKVTDIPKGVIDYVKIHDQDRITWQPRTGVRIAIVVQHVKGNPEGFVVVGRSLREVEARVQALGLKVGIAWLLTVLVAATASIFIDLKKR